MSKKQKKNLIRIIVALSLFLILFVIDKTLNLTSFINGPLNWLLPFGLYLIVYIIIGYDVIIKAVRNIAHGQVFDENFLMLVATIGAFALAIYKGVNQMEIEGFDEACAVLLFYQVGEFFQDYAVNTTRKSISSLMDIRPDYANVYRDGKLEILGPEEVKIGDIIVINPGEKVPLDGVVIKGNTSLDTKSLTGESLPRDAKENDEIISGAVNLTSQIEVKVTKEFYDSTVSKILELVESATNKKSNSENFISAFARVYTPIVVILALLLAIVPSFITGNWEIWVYRALSFLVVSCPCALVISIPLSFFSGIGVASKRGILIKGSNYLEKFSKANIFVFDKTGTLTKGNFAIAKVNPSARKDEILGLAAIAEQGSSHPIAKSILSAYKGKIADGYVITNVAGEGIIAKKDRDIIYCGNEKLMKNNKIKYDVLNEVGTIIYVAHNNEFIGSIVINDEIKKESKELISYLNSKHYESVMLTGDNEQVAENVAKELGLSKVYASLLPQNKAAYVEEMLAQKKSNDVLCFVGDGINDAPSIMTADIGIAMGGVGSDAAIEASDIVLMKDDLSNIIDAQRISHKTMTIVKENIIFAITVKVLILILSALGIANMWLAVFGDVGVAVIAILNAIRLFRIK